MIYSHLCFEIFDSQSIFMGKYPKKLLTISLNVNTIIYIIIEDGKFRTHGRPMFKYLKSITRRYLGNKQKLSESSKLKKNKKRDWSVKSASVTCYVSSLFQIVTIKNKHNRLNLDQTTSNVLVSNNRTHVANEFRHRRITLINLCVIWWWL